MKYLPGKRITNPIFHSNAHVLPSKQYNVSFISTWNNEGKEGEQEKNHPVLATQLPNN